MTRDDDLPIFWPHFGKGRRVTARSGNGSLRNAVLAAARGSLRRAAARRTARERIAVRPPRPRDRRVIVKAHVQRLTAGGAKAAALHLRYIERDGVEKDGSKGVLYGAEVPVRVEALEQPRPGEKHQFRLIVSPEDAAELDLTDYVRRLMANVERDLGRKLEWAAVNHYDTEHPHAHVVVRGVDRDGHELRFDRAYISKGLRWRAQELATEELGPRREVDLRRAHVREIAQERFTSLDRELERRAVGGRVEVRPGRARQGVDESHLVARLEHLEGLRLAERVSAGTWALAEGWQRQLRDLGSRGDILKQMHEAVCGDPARYHVLRRGQALETDAPGGSRVVSGRVANKGVTDELKGGLYAVVETPSGAAYHVPLDARAASELRAGDIVSFTTKPEPRVRPVDRQIAHLVGGNGGTIAVDGTDGDAARIVARLRELERLGLASAHGDRRWTVSPDLVRELETRRGPEEVRHRLVWRKEALSVEAQVQYAGPVWLDRVRPESLAPFGFGAELRRALEKRREVVRGLGVDPDQTDRTVVLREVERRTVGREIAVRTGQVFVPGTPDGLRGRVELQVTPGGASYATVSDGSRLAVLRVTTSLRDARGRTVEVMRDVMGPRIVVHQRDRGLGR